MHARALAVMAGSALAIGLAGIAYLQPSLLKLPTAAPPATKAGPAVLSSDYAAAYTFPTPSLGWALVADTTSALPRFSVFKTTDAARHWKRQLVKQPNQFALGALVIQFFDPSHGVIVVGEPTEIYRTSDGGTHWALVKTPTLAFSSFVPVDALHGWLLGWSGPPDQPVPNLLSTSDGGDTWTALPQALEWANGSPGFGPGFRNANFSFRNPREGWVGASAAEPIIYSSADGGASWQPHALPNNVASDLCTVDKPPPPRDQGQWFTNVSLLPGHGLVAISSDYCGHVQAYRSLDAGVAWRPLASAPGTTSWWTYVYQDWSHWWAMGAGDLWKSSDAGSSWKLVSQQTDGWGYSPHVIDANHAWAELFSSTPGNSYAAGLALTSDGGLHWSQVSTPKPG